MARVPRFLRTKHGVFVFYLSVLCACFVLFHVWLSVSLLSDFRRCEAVVCAVQDDTSVKLRSLQSLKEGVEKLIAESRGIEGGSFRRAPGSGADSGAPEPQREPAPIAEPQVVGVGQNGLYAYCDVRYPDGQVLRHYQRLPDGLRRGSRK